MRSKICLLLAFCCFAAHAADPESSKPVTASFTVIPQKIAPGKSADLLVTVRVLPTYHIYGLNKSGSENTPTTLQLQLPKGMKLKGDWKAPEPKKGKGKSRIYEEGVVFRGTLALGKSVAPGKHTIKCEMEYQVCDEELCWPPAKLDLATEIEVVASK